MPPMKLIHTSLEFFIRKLVSDLTGSAGHTVHMNHAIWLFGSSSSFGNPIKNSLCHAPTCKCVTFEHHIFLKIKFKKKLLLHYCQKIMTCCLLAQHATAWIQKEVSAESCKKLTILPYKGFQLKKKSIIFKFNLLDLTFVLVKKVARNTQKIFRLSCDASRAKKSSSTKWLPLLSPLSQFSSSA